MNHIRIFDRILFVVGAVLFLTGVCFSVFVNGNWLYPGIATIFIGMVLFVSSIVDHAVRNKIGVKIKKLTLVKVLVGIIAFILFTFGLGLLWARVAVDVGIVLSAIGLFMGLMILPLFMSFPDQES